MIENVHILQSKTCKALIQACRQIFFASPVSVRSVPHIITGFGCDHKFIPIRPEIFLQDPSCIFFRTAVDRAIEEDGVKKCCKEVGMGIIAFSPLAQGLLTDKYLHGIPQDSRIARDHRFLKAEALTPVRLKQISELNEIAKERGQSLAQMALSWILKDDEVCSVLIGASRPEQIVENISVVENTKFSEEELKRIDEICREA